MATEKVTLTRDSGQTVSDSVTVAAQLVSRTTNFVFAQRIGSLCESPEMEAELKSICLPGYQRVRLVQADHASVVEFKDRVANGFQRRGATFAAGIALESTFS